MELYMLLVNSGLS